MAHYHTVPNTLSFDAFDLEVGDVLTHAVYPEFTFAVTNKTKGKTTLQANPLTLYTATRRVFEKNGGLPETYKVTDLWLTPEGVTLTEVAQTKGLQTHEVKDASRKAPWLNNATYSTVYSNYRSADDVVRADEPTARGYKKGEAQLWASYLSGGEGASRRNKKLINLEVSDVPVSNCCEAPLKAVADVVFCGRCGHEATVLGGNLS